MTKKIQMKYQTLNKHFNSYKYEQGVLSKKNN